ncbi:hypothetical protein [Flammeovirga sp. SubArs3]|uniref:hypothetical protein n=1 Tax=Flammeovirga sp. SubArs3 TaxID=2995316 RepID=UPI00248ADF83|nr:hypothetical protein [Flammeovirga sp. SubArs3]
MKLTLSITFLVTLFSTLVQAQVTSNTNLYDLVDPDHLNTDLLYQNSAANFKGSPFYTDEWSTGFVTILGGEHYDDILIKYDAYKDEVLVRKSEDNVIIVDKKQINRFGWTDNDNEIISFEKKLLNNKPTYLEIIFKGETFNVYRYRVKKFHKKDEQNSNSYSEDIKDEYKWTSTKLYYDNGNSLTEISTKGKNFYSVFGDKKAEMQKFAKSNKLKVKDKKDLEEIFAHYSTIK